MTRRPPFHVLLHQGLSEGSIPFSELLHFTLDRLSDKQGCINYHFWVFSMTRPGIEPRSPGPLENTLPTRPMGWYLLVEYHHHVLLPARICLTLSRHFSLSSIAPRRSSRLHPVSALSGCMLVQAGWPVFAHPSEGVHWSVSLMSSSLLLQ